MVLRMGIHYVAHSVHVLYFVLHTDKDMVFWCSFSIFRLEHCRRDLQYLHLICLAQICFIYLSLLSYSAFLMFFKRSEMCLSETWRWPKFAELHHRAVLLKDTSSWRTSTLLTLPPFCPLCARGCQRSGQREKNQMLKNPNTAVLLCVCE